MRKLDYAVIRDRLIAGIKEEFAKAGFSKAVLGLSGGIDSALAAYLLVEALGAANVLCIQLPYKTSNPESLSDAAIVLNWLKIGGRKVDITPAVDAFAAMSTSPATPLRLGNIMARCRMTTLFDIAAAENALVVGTSNKTELMLGYGTLWGDLASIINPLGRLYKADVYALSRLAGMPGRVLDKAPSADLAAGQTDEGDFGFTYADADEILYGLYEDNQSEIDLENSGQSYDSIKKVLARVTGSRFKSRVPVIIEIS